MSCSIVDIQKREQNGYLLTGNSVGCNIGIAQKQIVKNQRLVSRLLGCPADSQLNQILKGSHKLQTHIVLPTVPMKEISLQIS